MQTLFVQLGDEQAVGLHHHLRVASLHADDDLVVVLGLADTQKLQRRLHHAQRRIAVAAQDAVGEGAVVGADAHSRAVLLADAHQRRELGPDPLQLGLVGSVGVVDLLELLLVGVVAGVDADLLHDAGGQLGGVRGEVDIGHQRRIVAPCPQPVFDGLQGLRLLQAGGRDADQLAACLDHADRLGDGAFDVHRIHRRHALDTDGVLAADAHGADPYLPA